MPAHSTLRIVAPSIALNCARCGCEGEYRNDKTNQNFVVTGLTGSLITILGEEFLTSYRSCYCAVCNTGCESTWVRRTRALLLQSIRMIGPIG